MPYGAFHNHNATNGIYMHTPQNFMQKFKSPQATFRPGKSFQKLVIKSYNMNKNWINKSEWHLFTFEFRVLYQGELLFFEHLCKKNEQD